jgi:hypothetical protein
MVEECLHTAALRQLLDDTRFTISHELGLPRLELSTEVALTSEGSGSPYSYVCFHPSSDAFSVLSVKRDLFPAFVKVHRGALRCSERRACRSADCPHVLAVQHVASHYPQSLQAASASVPTRSSLKESIHDELQVKCLSYRRLPFDCFEPSSFARSAQLREVFAREQRHVLRLVPDGVCICVSASSVSVDDAASLAAGGVSSSVATSAASVHCASCHTCCPAGHEWGEKLVEVSTTTRIVTLDKGVIEDVVVCERHCSDAGCSYVLCYDGQQDGYLAVSKFEVWDLRLLYQHGDTLATTGATFHELAAHVTALARQLPNQLHVTVGRDSVARAFWSFLSLLEEPSSEIQECAVCGPPENVPWWVVDGVNIGTLTERCNIDNDDRDELDVKSSIGGRDLYLYIPPKLRVLLRDWLSFDGLDAIRWGRLCKTINKYAPFLASLLPNKHRRQCPQHMRPFIEVFASQSISYALLCDPLSTSPLLRTLQSGAVFTQEHRRQLLSSMPELDLLLTGGDTPLAVVGQAVHENALPLLAALIESVERVEACAQQQPNLDELCERHEVSLEQDLVFGHSFHPGMRQRFTYVPRFSCDKSSSSSSSDTPPEEDVASNCRHAMNLGSRWAQMHIGYNCTHGIAYGASMVPERESLEAISMTLRERLGSAARFGLIYDFGCGYSRYTYYRDPAVALRQVVKVDRFHSVGHKNCSPAYSFKYNNAPSIARINTSAAEQRNALIARVGRQVRFMTGLHAVKYIAFVRAKQNAVKNAKLRVNPPNVPPSLPALPSAASTF